MSTGSGNISNGSSLKPNTHDPLVNTYCKNVRVIKNNVGNYALDWSGYSGNSSFGGRASKYTPPRAPNPRKDIQHDKGGFSF